VAEIHINVGVAALSRGFITLESFAKAMQALAESNGQSVRDLWSAFMTPDQLASVIEAVKAPAQDTTVFIAEPASVPVPSPPPRGSEDLSTKVGKNQPSKKGVPLGPATAPTAPSLAPPPPVASPAPTLAPPTGAVIDAFGNRYKRGQTLGKGGLGEVTACDDVVLGRTVAVKAGHEKGSEVDAYSARVILSREAKIISSLEHPNIIPIYDAGVDSTRGPYYVMRQVTDTSLELILHQRRTGEGNPHDYTLNRMLRYFLQVANAVDYAHHRGVIHCDIKPANILLGEYGEVLLVDWGLAQSRNHPMGVRGGTLGYMAPEQMDPHVERFDERTDVFALGAILYEILTGVPAFEEARSSDITTVGKDPFKLYKRPAQPSSVESRLDIPPEVEETCMQAISVQLAERLQTVRELSDAIEEWIEGSKQRERKRIEADKSADAGDELAERYHEFVESRPEKMTVFRALRADVVPWASTDDKQDLWDSEDIVRVTDALQVRTFQSAVSAYERALDAVPNHVRSRRGLARLYWSELERARASGEELDQIAYEQLLREVDDGTFVRELARDGQLDVTIGEHAGRVTLAKLAERQRQLIETNPEVITQATSRTLPAGNYVISATIGTSDTKVSWPVSIEAGATRVLAIDPPAPGVIGPNEIYVPGGTARLGGDPLSTETEELFVVDVPAFVIQRFPVTFEAWFEFLDALRSTHPMHLEAHVPRTTLGMPTWKRDGGDWIANSLPAQPLDPHLLPVFGISAESAEAYAAWLSQKEGRKWRLPTESEWEKAGRGTDGRLYPWGDHFDATFCKMRDSRPGLPLAEPIGAFASDVSPYGLNDLAGGVADWCIPDPRRTAPREPREVVSRGGAWCDWAIDCRLASRRRYLATEHSARVGVRLARDP
jgi:serine/threonine-protein kinase